MYFYIVGDVAVYRVDKQFIIDDMENWYGKDIVNRDMSDDSLEEWMVNNMDFEDLNAVFIGYRKEDFNRFASWEVRKKIDETKLTKIDI